MLERHKKWLVELFRQVQELRANALEKRTLALDIQEQLLYRIGRAERLIRQIRKDIRSIKKALAQPGTSKDVARKAKARNLAGTDRIEQQKTLISVLRSIGDSIAFIYGDRWDLKQLVQKEESGFLTGKKGTRLERGLLRKAFEVGATVVMNDLTHTLRHGDITLFRPDLWPDGGSPFLLIEAKSGRGGNRVRAARQMSATQQISEYLATDKREANGGLWRRISVNEHPQYHFAEVTRMISNLPDAGWLVEEVEPGLHYALIDCANELETFEPIFGELFGRSRPFMMSVNETKNHHLAYYPFPLCIQEPDAVFRFYNGEFVMFVIVDLEHVNKALAPHSIKVIPNESDEYPWQVSSTAEHNEHEIGVSYLGFHPLGRLAAEFLRLDWLLENMVAGPARDAFEQYLKTEL
ncbi:MAG: hypothetical protein ABSG62_03475 [Terracidiphilus sp.]|jgi:hypothetical protein